MTKEEILGKTPIIADKSGDNLYVNRKDALNAMGQWAEYLISQRSSITTAYDIPKHILDAFTKQQIIAFFTWYGVKMASFLEYLTKIKPISKSEEVEEAIRKHEGATFEELYNQFIESQNKTTNED